jgi:hypothetical protein
VVVAVVVAVVVVIYKGTPGIRSAWGGGKKKLSLAYWTSAVLILFLFMSMFSVRTLIEK